MAGRYDADVWAGRKPLTMPLRDERSSFCVGDFVYAREPVDPDGFPVIGGVVLHISPNEDGELLLRIAQHRIRNNRAEFSLKVLAASEIDPNVTKHAEPYQSGRLAAEIATFLGWHHVKGARWGRDDIELLGSAQLLARMNGDTH